MTNFQECFMFLGAGQCFCRAAELQLQLGSKHEAATHYVDAGGAYKKADPQGEHVVSLPT
jgi:alpha-soluble NSF attachment protein